MTLLPITFPESIDSTMLSVFDACPQKFLYEFVLQKVPVGRSFHLHVGGCLASAFESVRIDFYGNKLPLEECFVRAFPKFHQQWDNLQVPENEYKDFCNSWGVVEAYFREYPPDTDYFQPYMKADRMPGAEFRFAIPMKIKHPDTGQPILFSGRVDQLCKPLDAELVYCMDEKSTKALGAQWQYQWGMRGQFYGYTFAANYMGHDCAGVIVRGMAIQQTQYAFQEKLLQFTNHQLDIWWAEAHKKVARMIAMYDKAKSSHSEPLLHQAFDKSFGDACSAYGSCWAMDLCVHPYPWEIYKDYERRVWNPLEKDPTKDSEDRTKHMEEQTMAEFMGLV